MLHKGSKTDVDSICNMKNGKNKELPSFWIPAMTPDAAPTKVEKPVSFNESAS